MLQVRRTSGWFRALVWGVLVLAVAEQGIAGEELPARYYRDRADLESRYGRLAEAETLLETARARSATSGEREAVMVAQASLLETMGNVAGAHAAWSELCQSANPARAGEAHLRLAGLAERAGQGPQSLALYEAIALEGEVALHRTLAAKRLAVLLVENGTFAAKTAAYEASFNKTGDQALFALLMQCYADNAPARARVLEQYLASRPGAVAQRRQLGVVLLKSGRAAEAQSAFDSLRQDFPSQRQFAAEQLAALAMGQGDTARAREEIKRSAAALPVGARRELHLARFCLRLGLAEDAVRHATRGAECAEGAALRTASAMEQGEALFRLGRHDEARAVLVPVAEQSQWRGLQQRALALLDACAKRAD